MKRRWWIIALIGFQAVCTFFFVANMSAVIFGFPASLLNWQVIEVIQIGAALGLMVGLGLGNWVLLDLIRRNRKIENQLKIASGAFAELIRERFAGWNLTPAECDVALFAIKGMSLQEIADMRGTSTGTVKAQSNAIYRKAGVAGRSQLLSLFIEDLMSEALPGAVPEQPALEKTG